MGENNNNVNDNGGANPQDQQNQNQNDSTNNGGNGENQNANKENQNQDSNLVKTLRSEIDRRDEEIKTLRQQIEKAGGNPNADVKKLEEQVQALAFENQLAKKVPHLADQADEIFALAKKHPSMNFEEVVALYLGSDLMKKGNENSGNKPLPQRQISVQTGQPDYSKMSDEELFNIGIQELKDAGKVK